MHHQRYFIRTVRNEYDLQMSKNAIISHKLKALLASSLTSTNCKRLSIIIVEGCGLTIAHAYFGFEQEFAQTGDYPRAVRCTLFVPVHRTECGPGSPALVTTYTKEHLRLLQAQLARLLH